MKPHMTSRERVLGCLARTGYDTILSIRGDQDAADKIDMSKLY
jgi:hypothetical protein